MKEVKLFWEGLWDITEQKAPLNVPETGGILMLIDAMYTPNKIGFDTGTYKLIDLFESSNMYATILNHTLFQQWKEESTNRLLLKIAKIDKADERREILNLLVGNSGTPSGLILSNIGYKLPLKAYYSSPVKESAA
jgi:hypothetical protein